MRDMLLTCVEVSKRAKVPMLYLGNPGFAKTTFVGMFAKREGYHVESVIGAAFERSEILGYMVNEVGQKSLITKNPQWFQRIEDKAAEGIPSILFIDEIPTAPKDVQGSLYRLIFNRELSSGDKLPADCIIISAGNYKANLPVSCDVTAPSINRFDIINFTPRNFRELILEASMPKSDRENDLPVFDNIVIDEVFTKKCLDISTRILLTIENEYSGKDSSKGFLNIDNKELADIFEGNYSKKGEVYNFISMRSIDYFHTVFCAMASMRLKEQAYIYKIVDGLIGLGCNSFDEMVELENYQKFLHRLVMEGLDEVDGRVKTTVTEFKSNTVAEQVDELLRFDDELTVVDMQSLLALLTAKIMQTFPTSKDDLLNLLQQKVDELQQLKSDYLSLFKLEAFITEKPHSDSQAALLRVLQDIFEAYGFYMETMGD